MVQSRPMNGGDGINSYANNSTLQRNAAGAVMDVIKEALMENLDVEKLLSGSTRFAIADYGCSVGPNTFFAMQTLIETVENKYRQQGHDHDNVLEFQVFFNDQIGNDFNTLFASIPNPRNYFAAGVAGSFHGRLLPSSSIHIAYSSYALHWLSKLPEGLTVRGAPTWNGGRIHYSGGDDAVTRAYKEQFEADMDAFLRGRSEEMVAGGMVVIMIPCVLDEVGEADRNRLAAFFDSILMDMVKEGVIEEDEMERFNLPMVNPQVEEVERAVERNGSFEIVKMGLGDMVGNKEDVDVDNILKQFRAAIEGTFAHHFGNQKAQQLFARAAQEKATFAHIVCSYYINTFAQLCQHFRSALSCAQPQITSPPPSFASTSNKWNKFVSIRIFSCYHPPTDVN